MYIASNAKDFVLNFTGNFEFYCFLILPILLQQDFRKMYKALKQNEAFEGFMLGDR